MAETKREEYKLLDGRIIRCKYDRLGMAKISRENMEALVREFNASYRQAKILEKIKENYAFMKPNAVDREKVDKAIEEIKKLSPTPTAYDVVDGNPQKQAVWETIADVLYILKKHLQEGKE